MDETWEERAACKEFPDTAERKWWFPDSDRKMEADARAICASCPVLEECKKSIMTSERRGFRYGNQAGMTPFDRQRLQRTGSAFLPPKGERPGPASEIDIRITRPDNGKRRDRAS